ncbi:MAG TPA: FecR domain-containing protein [Gemmatimonadaceae bacterium]|jgi:ferric-dicitrate binding protein FerR (iron transport regulator)|nr:FecR domain-containing protein [Gemmatimonadaceae bacterium]
MADDEIDWVALDRYVAGEGTPEEREMMRRRIQASRTLMAIVAVLRSSHRVSSDAPDATADGNAAWRALAAQLGADSARPSRRQAPLTLIPSDPQRADGVTRLTRWAAMILLVAGASYASWREFRRTPRQVAEAPAIRAVYSTARGERATVELRDGTRVTLAPETELRVAAAGRQVYLSGEAVFSVTHDPMRPFRVIAPNGISVRDIGTQFDMRAYTGDKTVLVAVADGSVSLSGSAQPVILERGTLGVIESAGAARVTRGVTVDSYLAWAQGRLTFTNARMADVVPQIDRWYDIDVHLSSAKLADDRLTVTLTDVPVDVALDVIARALDARVARNGQSVTLAPKTSREGAHE